jgi:hypothetical protein
MSAVAATNGLALSELDRTLLADIDANEQALFGTLSTLVGFRTPNPPGGNEREAQDWMEKRFRTSAWTSNAGSHSQGGRTSSGYCGARAADPPSR